MLKKLWRVFPPVQRHLEMSCSRRLEHVRRSFVHCYCAVSPTEGVKGTCSFHLRIFTYQHREEPVLSIYDFFFLHLFPVGVGRFQQLKNGADSKVRILLLIFAQQASNLQACFLFPLQLNLFESINTPIYRDLPNWIYF